jgi:hypothetical protein
MDWIATNVFQIIISLGSLGTFATFIFLLVENKSKQKQIDKLAKVAEILKVQNETMKEQNDLIAQQVDIFRNTSLLKNNDNEAIKELGRIENKKLKLRVKPNLIANIGYRGFSGEMQIYINNNGEDARVLKVQSNFSDVTLDNFPTPVNLNKGQRMQLSGRQVGSKHIKDCNIDIDLTYSDKLDNKYVATITGTGSGVKITRTQEID